MQIQKLSTSEDCSLDAELVEPRSQLGQYSQLFAWTLTHSMNAFSEIKPIFGSHNDLLGYLLNYKSESYDEKIASIAHRKISDEWRAWVKVHSDMAIDEFKLDNILMMTLYRLIINRDSKKCVLCNSSSLLVIHHIIPKQRNILRKAPPFGWSVPTNLITLCQTCHSNFHSFFA